MKLTKVFLVLALTIVFVSSAIASEKTELNNETVTNTVYADRPATALSEFFYALLKKDVARFKKRLTNGTLEYMKDGAKKKDMTLDEALKAYLATNPMELKSRPRMQKQKLNGDKCTIEAYIDGKWEVIPLIKQGETWRVDFLQLDK